MTAEVITKYKSMFEEMTRENQEEEAYHVIDLATLNLQDLKDLKTVYQGYGFLGDAIDMIDARIKELEKS